MIYLCIMIIKPNYSTITGGKISKAGFFSPSYPNRDRELDKKLVSENKSITERVLQKFKLLKKREITFTIRVSLVNF